MDEVLLRRWCDLCVAAKADARVEAVVRYGVVITKESARAGAPRLIDCCEKHRKQIEELQLLVRSVGRAQPRDSDVPDVRTRVDAGGREVKDCPVCGTAMARQSVGSHLVDVHGATRVKQPKRCPDCNAPSSTDRGMLNHRRMTHGYEYMLDLASTVPKGKGKT